MARKKTEANLEARIHPVLKLAFPWLPPDDTVAELGSECTSLSRDFILSVRT